jgi:hypothetical protein
VKELSVPLAGAATGIAPGTEAGSQLLTTGKLAGSGRLGSDDALSGGAVIAELGLGLVVGVMPGVAASAKLALDGIVDGPELPGMRRTAQQPPATRATAIPNSTMPAMRLRRLRWVVSRLFKAMGTLCHLRP